VFNLGAACRVLTWAQQLMGREYLVGDQLVGKDVPSTAAPQVGVIAKLPWSLLQWNMPRCSVGFYLNSRPTTLYVLPCTD
jgi:hypothetical protein